MERTKLHKLLGIQLDDDYNIYDILQLTRIDGLTKTQSEKLSVLRDVITEYNSTIPVDKKMKVKGPNEAAGLMYMVLKGLDHEECWCLFLNRANRVLRRRQITIGGLTSTVIDTNEILRTAIELQATGIILAHNHPSGDPSPSKADIKQTSELSRACSVLDIAMIDHVILTDSCYYSFSDEQTAAYDLELLKELLD